MFLKNSLKILDRLKIEHETLASRTITLVLIMALMVKAKYGYTMKDSQRLKCYSWEDINIHNRDQLHVKFNNAQNVINYIWEMEGLKHPPKLKQFSKSKAKGIAGANRISIWIPHTGIKITILLHELAHSMTITNDGRREDHGAHWAGVFMHLLSRYADFDIKELMRTAKSAGIKYNFKLMGTALRQMGA